MAVKECACRLFASPRKELRISIFDDDDDDDDDELYSEIEP
jgi:hypothetical protein